MIEIPMTFERRVRLILLSVGYESLGGGLWFKPEEYGAVYDTAGALERTGLSGWAFAYTLYELTQSY